MVLTSIAVLLSRALYPQGRVLFAAASARTCQRAPPSSERAPESPAPARPWRHRSQARAPRRGRTGGRGHSSSEAGATRHHLHSRGGSGSLARFGRRCSRVRTPTSAGQMKRRRRPTRVELAVAADRLARRQRLDLDASLPEPLDRLRVGLHLRVRSRAHDQVLGQLVNDVIEIGEDETVPVRAPPVGHHTVGENDQISRLLLAVDDEMTEAVSLESRHPSPPISASCPSIPAVDARTGLRVAYAAGPVGLEDRKSTRLNSSHGSISYAVFCLTKKKTDDGRPRRGNSSRPTARLSGAVHRDACLNGAPAV